MAFEDFMARLDPKTAKRLKTAQEIELVKFPLASTGLTTALGGGIGAGRITLVYGNTSSGKSVLMMQTIGLLQKQGKVCAWVDVEGTYEKSFGARLGINNDELILIQKKSFGAITDNIMPLIRGGIDVVVIDSISDALPEVFVDKDGEAVEFEKMKQLGAHAKSCTMMVNAIHYENEKTAVVLISQTTTKIEATYVKQVPHGGQKVPFASSQIIKLTSSNTENQQKKGITYIGDLAIEAPIGRKVEYYVEKNKLGPQSRKGEYDLYYDGDFVGIDAIGETVDAAEKYGIVTKKGAWYTVEEGQIQGRDNVIAKLREDDVLLKTLKEKVNLVLTGELPDDEV
ncbi:RecA-like DNA recombinase [Streptomyces phage TunaTartare]|uniref:RecA-like DNA recombinase n=1 Tax=Streptomyces phage TunaTartare TaxID=2848887 RepID=A0A8F2IWA8_9CAUD|nr:UvsX-like recombinase [Streptomyces phage TunaTartare]QWT29955.1 RecA-like DNA recombinase [Streptomyces phage TunaTartare]